MREINENEGRLTSMIRGHQRLFLALLAVSTMLAVGFAWPDAGSRADNPRQQKKVVEQQKQDPAEEYTEEEYDAYEKATKEPDLAKRGAALIAFMEKYPKSKLQVYIVTAYQNLMFEYQKAGDYAKLEPVAEQWLKYAPNDLQTIAFVAEAAQRLGHDQKFIEYGEKVFAQKPLPHLASAIYLAYQKLGNEPKKMEWALKLLQYPEFNDNFELRWQFVSKYAEADLPKAADYAQQTLKSLALAKKPEATSEADWNKAVTIIRHTCYNILGMNYFNENKYPQALQSLETALKIKQYDAGYYYIGMIQWKENSIEDAIDSFAAAELLKGDFEARAKKNCEELYKPLHGGNLTGIEKVYRRIKAKLDAARGVLSMS